MSKKTQSEAGPPEWLRMEGAISATSSALRRTYDGMLAHTGLSLPEVTLLGYVIENGPLTQTQIATGLAAGRAITGLRIDSLEERGYLRRDANPADRRVWLIAPTDAGREVSEELFAIDQRFRDGIRDGISPAQRRAFVKTLLRIQGNLEMMAADHVAEEEAPKADSTPTS